MRVFICATASLSISEQEGDPGRPGVRLSGKASRGSEPSHDRTARQAVRWETFANEALRSLR